jgi:glutamine amidotransferase
MIVVVDYGMGNVRSIEKIFDRLEVPIRCSADAAEMRSAKALILPGVGSFGEGMKNLRERGLIPVLSEQALERKVPVLGICLGMQLMSCFSEEGNVEGLGWVRATTRRFPAEPPVRVPHVGMNRVAAGGLRLFSGIPADSSFYFVHSYYVSCEDSAIITGKTTYGIQFDSALEAGNIFGVQFHPEKSHQPGLELYRNFVAMV